VWNLRRFNTSFKFYKNHSSENKPALKHSHLQSSGRICHESLRRYVCLRLYIITSCLSRGGPSRRSLRSCAISARLNALVDVTTFDTSAPGWTRTNNQMAHINLPVKSIYPNSPGSLPRFFAYNMAGHAYSTNSS
jgi:hypothetical protein